jgi:hypothetical protein
MNSEAIHKAARKLESIRRAVEAMKYSKDPINIEEAWEIFVNATGSFYSALEQGAKENDKSKAWFGRKKHERKSDPLLRYLHQARNADEHGIKRITDRTNSHITLKQGASATLRSDGKKWDVIQQDGDIEFPNDVVRLVRVHDDRFHDWYDPPSQHLGRELSDLSPAAVAGLAFDHLGQVLSEAAAL